jgi:hypothetical protein
LRLYSRNVYVNESLLIDSTPPATCTVNVTVLSVTPARAGRLFALVSVEIEIAAVVIELHGIRALRVEPAGTRIELPQFRDAAGVFRSVVTLPAEVYGPIGDAVLDALVERGFAKRRFAAA